MTEGLFAEPALPMGRVEKGTAEAVCAARAKASLIEEDEGLIQAALCAARALDRAERLPDKSSVYAVAQLMRPYQDAMNALRLPVALSPATPPAPEPAGGQGVTPDWLRDAFGTPS